MNYASSLAGTRDYAAILLPIAYIGDQLYGQLARASNRSTDFGYYLDDALDLFKIFLIIGSLSIAQFIKTQNIIYVFLSLFLYSFLCLDVI